RAGTWAILTARGRTLERPWPHSKSMCESFAFNILCRTWNSPAPAFPGVVPVARPADTDAFRLIHATSSTRLVYSFAYIPGFTGWRRNGGAGGPHGGGCCHCLDARREPAQVAGTRSRHGQRHRGARAADGPGGARRRAAAARTGT